MKYAAVINFLFIELEIVKLVVRIIMAKSFWHFVPFYSACTNSQIDFLTCFQSERGSGWKEGRINMDR